MNDTRRIIQFTVLAAVLALPVSVWAGEEWHIDAAGNSQWRCTKDKATCEVWTAIHLRLHEQLCHQRMREAMLTMTPFLVDIQKPFRLDHTKPEETLKQWNQTMKDCVEGR